MRKLPGPAGKLALVGGVFLVAALSSWTQVSSVRTRIVQPVEETKLTVLRGNTHPFARAEFDRGAAPDNLPMDRMLLVLQRSPEQEAVLDRFLTEQQDPSSPNFHKALTATEFGQQFGPSELDIATITRWLESHGFKSINVATGRMTIEFSGTAGQVRQVFHTPIHKFVVNGEEHWANVQDPAIPSALTPAVVGVRSLHNFFPKPMSRVRSGVPSFRSAENSNSPRPQFTFNSNTPCGLTNLLTCFGVGPADFATIYNLAPLYSSGIDGTGETIAVLNDSNINQQDVADFRGQFGLPAKAPVVTTNTPNCSDPGLTSDEVEAILDVEWSGAVAKNATINLVACKTTNTTFGGDLAATCVVNSSAAAPCPNSTPPPIISYSFGLCELMLGTAGNTFYNQTWQQAATAMISVIVSSGDNGSAGCDPLANVANAVVQPAQDGLAVSGVASTPFNTAVGGTEFNDIANPLLYWNNPPNGAGEESAKGYVPEMAYNDSCTAAAVINFFKEPNVATSCNDPVVQAQGFVVTIGGSGGVSNCTTSDGMTVSSCSGGYAKPTWQNALTPTDGKRDLPDVSLFAGDGTISGSFYIVCQRDFSGINGAACNLNNGTFLLAGGTSVSAQAFAGVMALVDQKKGVTPATGGLGLINPRLYAMATTEPPPASCNSAGPPTSTCVFNDITVDRISMPCLKGTPNCTFPAAMVAPRIRPGQANAWTTAAAATLVCLFCVGAFLLTFPGKPRRMGAALAVLALAFLIGGAGCGSGNGSGAGGTGSNNTIGDLPGDKAGTGYDLATGLGSVNAQNLVNSF